MNQSIPELSLVGMPLGNPDDITLRALKVLKEADLLLCEERKTTARYFKGWGIPFPKESHLLLNEHTTPAELEEIKEKLLSVPQTVLVSDSGMPVLCDPGEDLVRWAHGKKITLRAVPGPVALTVALTLCGLGGGGFSFLGFPPRESGERAGFYKAMERRKEPLVFYETPYRIEKVIKEIHNFLPGGKKVFVAVNITMENEFILNAKVGELSSLAGKIPKGPPVFIIYD